jgi:hypothetical protein
MQQIMMFHLINLKVRGGEIVCLSKSDSNSFFSFGVVEVIN